MFRPRLLEYSGWLWYPTGCSTWRSDQRTCWRVWLFLITYIPLQRLVFLWVGLALWRVQGPLAASFAFYRREFCVGVMKRMCCLALDSPGDIKDFWINLFTHAGCEYMCSNLVYLSSTVCMIQEHKKIFLCLRKKAERLRTVCSKLSYSWRKKGNHKSFDFCNPAHQVFYNPVTNSTKMNEGPIRSRPPFQYKKFGRQPEMKSLAFYVIVQQRAVCYLITNMCLLFSTLTVGMKFVQM